MATKKLFANLKFFLRPCEEKKAYRIIIEENGGLMVKDISLDVIRLAISKDESTGVHIDFISKSFELNQLQDMEKYSDCSLQDHRALKSKKEEMRRQLFIGKCESSYLVFKFFENSAFDRKPLLSMYLLPGYAHPDITNTHIQVDPLKLGKTRQKYDPEEDDAMLQYIAKYASEEGEVGSIKGNSIFKAMENKKVTVHSWQSMKARYLKHLQHKQPAFQYNPLKMRKNASGQLVPFAVPSEAPADIPGPSNISTKTKPLATTNKPTDAIQQKQQQDGKMKKCKTLYSTKSTSKLSFTPDQLANSVANSQVSGKNQVKNYEGTEEIPASDESVDLFQLISSSQEDDDESSTNQIRRRSPRKNIKKKKNEEDEEDEKKQNITKEPNKSLETSQSQEDDDESSTNQIRRRSPRKNIKKVIYYEEDEEEDDKTLRQNVSKETNKSLKTPQVSHESHDDTDASADSCKLVICSDAEFTNNTNPINATTSAKVVLTSSHDVEKTLERRGGVLKTGKRAKDKRKTKRNAKRAIEFDSSSSSGSSDWSDMDDNISEKISKQASNSINTEPGSSQPLHHTKPCIQSNHVDSSMEIDTFSSPDAHGIPVTCSTRSKHIPPVMENESDSSSGSFDKHLMEQACNTPAPKDDDHRSDSSLSDSSQESKSVFSKDLNVRSLEGMLELTKDPIHCDCVKKATSAVTSFNHKVDQLEEDDPIWDEMVLELAVADACAAKGITEDEVYAILTQ